MWLLWTLIIAMMLIMAVAILFPLWNSNKNNTNKSIWFSSIFVLLFIPLLTIPLYLHWGDSQQLEKRLADRRRQQQINQFMAQFKNPQQVIDQLKQRLSQQPNSAQGWYLLGRLYFTSGKMPQAVDAFAKANQLKANDVTIMLQYTQALYFYQKQSLAGKAEQLIHKVLAEQPNNPMAINLIAVNAYQHQDYQTAIKYWEKLLALFPEQSKNKQIIVEAIAKARKHSLYQKKANT